MEVDGPITSPTYVLARVHPARRPGAPALVHVDFYRLLDHGGDLMGELDSLDLDTDLTDAVVVVEWGEGWPNGSPNGIWRSGWTASPTVLRPSAEPAGGGRGESHRVGHRHRHRGGHRRHRAPR